VAVLDAPLRKAAKKVIGKFGTSGTVEFNRQGRYDTTTGTTLGAFTEDVEVKGVIGEFKRDELGDLIQATDLKWEVAAKALSDKGAPEPGPKETVTLQAKKYQVVTVRPTYSGDDPATFVLALRR